MAQALRVVSIQRGYNPASFKLVPFGGAGPLHALAVAAQTGIANVLVPPRPGVASAVGLLVADLKHDFAVTLVRRVDGIDVALLEKNLSRLEDQGREPLRREGIAESGIRFERALDLRYVGQSYHLTIPLPAGRITRERLDMVRRRFDEAHLAAYGYGENTEPCEVVNARVSAIGAIRTGTLRPSNAGHPRSIDSSSRLVWFEETGFVKSSVHDRVSLAEGTVIEGPAVLEDRDATTLIHPGWRCNVVAVGALRVERLR
jgi:N-methylhydantoinase A